MCVCRGVASCQLFAVAFLFVDDVLVASVGHFLKFVSVDEEVAAQAAAKAKQDRGESKEEKKEDKSASASANLNWEASNGHDREDLFA
jgi:hypothetical protein